MRHVVAVALTLVLLSMEVRAQPACKPTASSSEWQFTRVLIPVLAYGLPGAGGSIWQTDLWITNPTNQPVVYFFHPCNQACCCAETNTICPQSTAHNVDDRPRGRWIAAPVGGLLRFSVRLRDLSRNASSAGIDLPIVREDEFRSDEINLIAIPRDPRFRLTVRLYGLDAAPLLSVEQIDVPGNVVRTDQVQLQPAPVDAPGYAQLSLDPSPQATDPVRIRIRSLSSGVSFWAFASVTNNDTSEVTLILPSR